MTGWENVAFIHLCITRYISPPELVCLILTSRDLCETYGNPETYRAVAKSFFGPAVEGPRGHLSRRHRKKKGVVWRAGDGAKARLSLLWRERTRTNVLRLQNAHLLQQRGHERRWVLQQTAAVMRTCAYASRHHGSCCSHAKLRLWTSANIVAAKHLTSSRSQERAPSHHGVQCSRCGMGPVVGSCYRCAAGCHGPSGSGGGGGRGASARGRQQRRSSSRPGLQSPGGVGGRDEGERSGGGGGGGGGKSGGRSSVERDGGSGGESSGDGVGGGCYTLCEACFSERRRFHPPHPFARLRAGFAESRLSGPVLYEAVCGDCSFGSLLLVRPLKAREALGDPCGSGALWAVPVRVEAAGPLPLSQVKSRIAAGDRDDNRGLAFASDNWLLQHQQQQMEEGGGLEGGDPVDPPL